LLTYQHLISSSPKEKAELRGGKAGRTPSLQ